MRNGQAITLPPDTLHLTIEERKIFLKLLHAGSLLLPPPGGRRHTGNTPQNQKQNHRPDSGQYQIDQEQRRIGIAKEGVESC